MQAFNPAEGRASLKQTWPLKEERARLRAVSPTGMLMDFEKQKIFGLFTLPSSSIRDYRRGVGHTLTFVDMLSALPHAFEVCTCAVRS